MRIIGKILKWLFIFFLALLLVGLGYYFAVTKDAHLSSEKLALSENSVTLYDNDNVRIASSHKGFIGQTVQYESIPVHTIRAFVDTEDKRFFKHNGFDYKRIVKSAFNNLRARSFQQGASTISQQLIKNTHLSQEKTLKRKLSEWKLTKQLEKKYTKKEIIEKYLNVIYFGHSCFGIQSAAEFYFGKTVQELDIADSAILAGLVKSPNNYSPFKNPENCQKRKSRVLRAMRENGSINDSEYTSAMEKALPTTPNRLIGDNGYAQLVFDELSSLSEKHQFTVGGKLEIYTYMDKTAQDVLVKMATDHNKSDKSFCVLDTKTHGYKAYVSSVGEIRRLPGSLLKPLLVYAPAIEENLLSPATPILDEPIDYSGYTPQNYDGNFHGYISAREALSKSLNIPAVKVLESIGIEKAASYLRKMDLPVNKEDYSLALALGGMKKGYTLSSLVNGYATLACGGEYLEGGFIKEIKIDGISVYKKNLDTTRVFSKESAYLTTNMLQTATQSGTAKKLRTLPFEIAAKTGTVGTDKGNTDAYVIGYTPNEVIGIWLGNANNSTIGYTGGGLPTQYLLQIQEALAKQNDVHSIFQKPDGIISAQLDKLAYNKTHSLTLADPIAPAEYRFCEVFKKDNLPTITADYFSAPKIEPPTITLQNGQVVIQFNEEYPLFYEYIIKRKNGKNEVVLYQGERILSYVDDNISNDERYVYTVTPKYKENVGKCVTLPKISTKKGEKPMGDDKKILDKHWWEE